MIQTEIIDGRIRRWSNRGVMLRKVETGELYEDALDYPDAPYTYEETELPIDEELTPEQALDIILGGDGNEQSESN
ncbi:MAG: hypothetical protein IKF99_08630 [Oscillospiraceae bacterium]|nr:hypothetical protein [Oscillospiraceae bacterium]